MGAAARVKAGAFVDSTARVEGIEAVACSLELTRVRSSG